MLNLLLNFHHRKQLKKRQIIIIIITVITNIAARFTSYVTSYLLTVSQTREVIISHPRTSPRLPPFPFTKTSVCNLSSHHSRLFCHCKAPHNHFRRIIITTNTGTMVRDLYWIRLFISTLQERLPLLLCSG
jgi:hypothetical protein